MDMTQFSAEMAQRGCVADSNGNFCGTYNGYPFTVLFRNGRANGATSFVLGMVLAGNIKQVKFFKEIRRKVKAAAGNTIKIYNGDTSANNAGTYVMFGAVGGAIAAAGSAAMVSGNVITATIKKQENFATAFEALMGSTVQTAVEMGYGVPDLCPVCKQGGCDSYAFYENGYRPVHDACVREKAVETATKHDENQRKGSYLLGTVGAILGALVGTIPNILLYIFLDLISIACVLIPIFAYYGYRLLNGKRTKLATIIVVIVSLLAVLPMDYALTWYYNEFLHGYPLSIADYILWARLYPEDFLYDWGIQLFFVVLGIAVAWGIIKKDGSGEVQSAAFSVDTLRPMRADANGVPGMGAAVVPGPAPTTTTLPDTSAAPAPTMQSAAALQAEKDLEA